MRLGIRAQLSMSLGALLLLALLPLLFVVDRLTTASMRQSWELNARALGRAIAGHVGDARAGRADADLDGLLAAQLGSAAAVGLYDPRGARAHAAGAEQDARGLPEEVDPNREQVRRIVVAGNPALLVVVPGARGPVAALIEEDPRTVRAAPVVRLVALYTGLLGATLLIMSTWVLTRLVVAPVETLRRAAGKVADGARELPQIRAGGKELIELGASLGRMTAALRAEEAELRRTLSEHKRTTEQLGRAQDTVVKSERLASVGRLAAGLAHEIGNPIAAILAYEELLEGSANLDAEERDFIVRMKRETERVHRILRDLLDFARPARTALAEEPAAQGSVAAAIEQVAQLVRPQKALREVQLITTTEGELPLVAMTPERIEQVLLNLVLNAADAVPKPGGEIAVRATRSERGVCLAVEDNGGGVDPAIEQSLFEPFVTTKPVGEGTGLGLAVCRGLIEAAGGTIRLERGRAGARFVIDVPQADAISEPRARSS